MEQLKIRGAAQVRKNLNKGKDVAFLSRDLATVKRDVPVNVELEQLKRAGFDIEKVRTLFTELEFANLIKLIENGG